MLDPLGNRQQLEDLWREKVKASLARYWNARAECQNAVQEQKDQLTPSPDGAFAVSLALKKESEALAQYKRVMRIFTDLVVHGKIPKEPPDLS
jgi:hypothetical protein